MMIRSIAGLVRYWPRAALAALVRIPLSELPTFLTAYRKAAVGGEGTCRLRLRDFDQPFFIRHGTSDFAVFCQVLLEDEYGQIPQSIDVRTIVDAGANVGYSTRYLLKRFPAARAIAIEPDSNNLSAAKLNLSCVSDRCELVHGALWSQSGQVSVMSGIFRDGREWSTSVKDSFEANAPVVAAMTVDDVMGRFEISGIDVLKIDIEGAEVTVFSANTDFMSTVRCCAIELHDHEARRVFHEVCQKRGFSTTSRGETTIALRDAVA